MAGPLKDKGAARYLVAGPFNFKGAALQISVLTAENFVRAKYKNIVYIRFIFNQKYVG